MATGDLTTLANVKTFLALGTSTADDATLTRFVHEHSRAILDYLQRPSLVSTAFQEMRDGKGTSSAFLPNWPVTSVQSVVIDGKFQPPAPTLNGVPIGPGFFLEPWDGCSAGGPQKLSIIGGRCGFSVGCMNILIAYTAGYLVSAEAQTVPDAAPYQLTALQDLGPWSADGGVAYANGTQFVTVPSAPGQGQYSVAAGVYTFNAADAGQAVILAYSYTPATVEDACISWIAERYKYRGRIGVRSKAIGDGQTESYDLSDVPAYIKTQLQQYRKVLPL